MGPPSPTVVEVSEHPDHRQIATFFLGWAFVASLQCLVSSGVHSDVRRRFCGTRAPNTDSEKASAYETTSNITIRSVHPSFMFVLSLCFMFASIAYFASLLSFNSGGGTVCAFVVAWGGLSAQFGRLVALSVILVALRQLGIGRIETLIYVGWLVAGLGVVFANFAIGTGSISKYNTLNIYLCHREHNLGLSLASSFMYSLIEVYAIGRILSLTYSQSQHALVWLGDFRVRRAFSLLVLELLTMVPSALFTGVLGEFVPFSIGAVIVLLTFQQHYQQTVPVAPVVPVAQKPSDAAALRDFYLASNRHVASLRSHRASSRPRHSVRQSIPYAQPPTILDHPYSAKSLEDPTLEADRWMSGYRTYRSSRRSSRTIDSRSLRSVGEAVVEVVRRARYPWARPSSSEIPALPAMNSTLSLVRPRLIMLEGSHQYANEDVKPDTPITVQLSLPDPALDPLKSHFSMSSKSGSVYRTSESVSLPSSPYPSHRSGSLTSSKVTSDRSDIQLSLPSLPATPPSPASSSIKSRAVSVSTVSIIGSDRHSILSDVESTTTGQVVTIMPPPALPAPSLHLRIPSESRPRQFRAAGYANPIPLPKFPRDMSGSARGPKADVPRSVGSRSS